MNTVLQLIKRSQNTGGRGSWALPTKSGMATPASSDDWEQFLPSFQKCNSWSLWTNWAIIKHRELDAHLRVRFVLWCGMLLTEELCNMINSVKHHMKAIHSLNKLINIYIEAIHITRHWWGGWTGVVSAKITKSTCSGHLKQWNSGYWQICFMYPDRQFAVSQMLDS